MVRVAVRGALWFGLYVAVAVCPLVFAAIGIAEERRGFWREFAVALGFVGLSMMGMQLVLVARIKTVAAPFGEDALVAFHRYLGYAGTAFVFAHPVLLIVLVDPSYIVRVIPWTAPWAGRFGTLAILCLLGIIVTSVWRVRLRISYETWQVIHLVASAVAIIAAVVHVELINYYIDRPWKRVLWIVMSAALLGVSSGCESSGPPSGCGTRGPSARWSKNAVGSAPSPFGRSITPVSPSRARPVRLAVDESVTVFADAASVLVLLQR